MFWPAVFPVIFKTAGQKDNTEKLTEGLRGFYTCSNLGSFYVQPRTIKSRAKRGIGMPKAHKRIQPTLPF
jgi:hypothetical protein